MTVLNDGAQYVTLGVDREVFAVGVETVREILDVGAIVRLPNAPPFLIGLSDVRGQAVPVIDLRIKLGLPATPYTENTRIVVLDIPAGGRPMVLGLLADRVFEVTALDGGGADPAPEIGVRWRSEYIRGIGRRGDSLVIVFNLSRLLSSDEVALLDGREAA
ncbi:MAG: chemotaxis protein CheW [Magnetospirillum sp.]|nr:chemotaxis protein CheW [Magnetospirillum sp.]